MCIDSAVSHEEPERLSFCDSQRISLINPVSEPECIPFSNPKRISFVYVLSQNEGKGPYKVGISKGDLWRRMSNYATAFVDFYVYYLVPVPYADAFAVERFMHRALPGRSRPSRARRRSGATCRSGSTAASATCAAPSATSPRTRS